MIKRQIILILFFVFGAMQIVNAQENKLVVLNLKNGYSVKGEIIEQTVQGVKIKLLNGEIFEYKADEISSTADAKLTSPMKVVPQVIAKGDKIANFGLGIGSTLYSGSYYTSTLPPLSASLEVILKDDLLDGNVTLGVGGYLGFSTNKYKYNEWGWKYTNIIIGPRGYFHYNFIDKLDTYTGVLLGYNIVSAKEFGSHTSRAFIK